MASDIFSPTKAFTSPGLLKINHNELLTSNLVLKLFIVTVINFYLFTINPKHYYLNKV